MQSRMRGTFTKVFKVVQSCHLVHSSQAQLNLQNLDAHQNRRGWTEEAILYVHWPYCRRRCTYCNFNKYIDSSVDHDRMRECLVREAQTLIELSGVQCIKSVFFGGGTPSMAKPQTLQAVLEAVSGLVELPSNVEVTLEANPTSVDLSKLMDFKQAGINRVSLGIQALNDHDLKMLGRDHTTVESIQCIQEASRLFPGRTSLDLIFGRPGQSLSSWKQELTQVLAICDNHVSLYQLTLERGTPMFKIFEQGVITLPCNDEIADMYSLGVQMMAEKGLNRYEVSNFARSGSECQHNLSYWEAQQYIGVGPGAHGRFTLRSETTKGHHCCTREARIQTLEPHPWMYEVYKYGHGTRKRVRQSQLDILQELMTVGLRTRQGVTSKRWAELAGDNLKDIFRCQSFNEFVQTGLLVNDSEGLRATDRGLAVLDSILPYLLLELQAHYQTNK